MLLFPPRFWCFNLFLGFIYYLNQPISSWSAISVYYNLKQSIFSTKVFSNISLMEYNDICGLKFLHIHGGSCCDTKTLLRAIVSFLHCHSKHTTLLTKGESDIEKMTTPVCSGVSSVILPKCAFTIWLPYKKGISPLGLIQILCYTTHLC